ncbi:hypothetical protein C8A00DRAFT_38376 [Chaetomidium leptoderma]|uniref:SNF2 N-terminal domain-containing protein n=1 Tax=Chaetomidium leptoderma TaxID=669021 RepID=A0AAN6VDT1_9PEZI|nr:hypothetical protein C8A00DRAFT_38376 [Chaetomidium leptoderma]
MSVRGRARGEGDTTRGASERGDNNWEGENLLQDIDAYERGDGDGENPPQDIDASLRPTDDLLLWASEECEFFCHDKSRTAHNQGVQLLGTNIPLRPMQMDVVYRFLRQCFRGDLGGGIMALDTGLGKTIIALAIIAVMRLAELNFAEVQSEWTSTTADGMAAVAPRRHNQQGEAGPCPSGNRWSIQCCCVAGSLTLDIALRQGPGPSLALTPANVVTQFAKEASKYLQKDILVPGSSRRVSFVRARGYLVNDPSTLSHDIRTTIRTDFLSESLPRIRARKNASVETQLASDSVSEIGSQDQAQLSNLANVH